MYVRRYRFGGTGRHFVLMPRHAAQALASLGYALRQILESNGISLAGLVWIPGQGEKDSGVNVKSVPG
jgi:hypothetical protein